jgi:Domain of unknown function (DUF4157)
MSMVGKNDEAQPAADAQQSAGIQGGGAPLPPTAQRQMEMRFGQDLSAIRVHTVPSAAFRMHGVDARAYSEGDNIHFKPGAYDPHSADGQKILAHEVAHVVQQRAGRVADPSSAGQGAQTAEQAVNYGVSAPAVSAAEAGAAEGAYL